MSADHRALAARWLGTLHGLDTGTDFKGHLPDRGPGFYLQLLRVSRASLLARAHHPALSPADVRLLGNLVMNLEEVEALWPEVETLLDGHPRALVHGDFVVKNLRVRPAAGGSVLAVIDWETAGWGVPAADLAQFVGRCASPDLDVYASLVARAHPGTPAGDIRRLAVIGTLLRMVHKVYWLTLSMVGDTGCDLAEPLQCLTLYGPQFARALHGLHREAA